jgi:CBS domain containing-hemolysin-like protein
MDPELIIIISTILFSAFVSGMEIAFISANRLKIEMDRSKGTLNGRILGSFYKNESHFIAMLLLANNVSLVIFGISAAKILKGVIINWGVNAGNTSLILLIQTVISTLLVLILAEFTPKALVQINPNGFLRFASIPMLILHWILYLPTQIVMFISNFFLKLLKTSGDTTEKVFSKVDLEHYVQDLSGRIKEEEDFGNEMQILQNALDFSSLKARDCMVPRIEIIAMDVEEDISVLQAAFVKHELSKILIYRNNIDNIIGYVHSFEMFKKPTSIKQILHSISFVPESISGEELLEMFTQQSSNVAIVVDEYGGTSGMITIEDVIEEIFGEIEDEHDSEDLLEVKISEKEYLFSGRVDIDYVNENYQFKLEESEQYETIAGLIINNLESIPEVGTKLALENYTIIIEQVSDRKIEVVRIILK